MIELDQSLGDWQQLRRAVLQVYDVRDDDGRLRRMLLEGESTEAMDMTPGQRFDYLRKHYPVRREFHNYRIASGGSEQLNRTLATLGFQLLSE